MKKIFTLLIGLLVSINSFSQQAEQEYEVDCIDVYEFPVLVPNQINRVGGTQSTMLDEIYIDFFNGNGCENEYFLKGVKGFKNWKIYFDNVNGSYYPFAIQPIECFLSKYEPLGKNWANLGEPYNNHDPWQQRPSLNRYFLTPLDASPSFGGMPGLVNGMYELTSDNPDFAYANPETNRYFFYVYSGFASIMYHSTGPDMRIVNGGSGDVSFLTNSTCGTENWSNFAQDFNFGSPAGINYNYFVTHGSIPGNIFNIPDSLFISNNHQPMLDFWNNEQLKIVFNKGYLETPPLSTPEAYYYDFNFAENTISLGGVSELEECDVEIPSAPYSELNFQPIIWQNNDRIFETYKRYKPWNYSGFLPSQFEMTPIAGHFDVLITIEIQYGNQTYQKKLCLPKEMISEYIPANSISIIFHRIPDDYKITIYQY